MKEDLQAYIEEEIIPRYAAFDEAHRVDHARTVIEQSLALAEHYEVDRNMVYAIAAYHDTGLCEGRERHHLVSGRIIREDKKLLEWFDEDQIEMMAQVIWKIADGLWLTIDKKHILTHGEAANNEDDYYDAHNPYSWWNDSYGDGDTRGDLEYLGTDESPRYNPQATDGSRGGDVLRGKANWYRNEYGGKHE